ncbi:hypothetical protein CHS0354_020612 [Potamilus streckersoni]|uniref:Cadherin domain-containing protein n=1 Tax=Potamilus streckersoni TaxID=2493646 RepID=A0AAE0VHM6_9BIVA|nr:hypothetical protein CHS0354_020612 [Potamilus streckersoni]
MNKSASKTSTAFMPAFQSESCRIAINEATGEIVTNCKPEDLDREKLERLYLSIFAKDGGGLINQTQLIVNLLDKNDNSPKFQQEVYTAFLDENSEVYVNRSFLTVQVNLLDINLEKGFA